MRATCVRLSASISFVWPRLGALVDPSWQPTLVYPARGLGMLWQRSDPVTLASLEALLGKRRTAVLVELGSPRSTTELGRRLGLSAPSVSQHLSVLRGAGIVRANRVGRAVLCSRTAVGDALVAAGAPAHSGQLM